MGAVPTASAPTEKRRFRVRPASELANGLVLSFFLMALLFVTFLNKKSVTPNRS